MVRRSKPIYNCNRIIMKTKYIIVTLLCLLTVNIYAQNSSQNDEGLIAHNYNSQSIEANYLITKYGSGVQISLANANKKSLFSRYILTYENGDIGDATTSYDNVAIGYNLLKPLLNKENKLFFNVGFGVFANYEMLKNKILDRQHNNLSIGCKARIETEYFIKRIGFGISADQLYRPFSDIGDLQWQVSFGIKFLIHN